MLQASLDAETKRIITLTTTPNRQYDLHPTVTGVRDRTPQQNAILSGTTANFQSGPVAEAANYSLVYS